MAWKQSWNDIQSESEGQRGSLALIDFGHVTCRHTWPMACIAELVVRRKKPWISPNNDIDLVTSARGVSWLAWPNRQ